MVLLSVNEEATASFVSNRLDPHQMSRLLNIVENAESVNPYYPLRRLVGTKSLPVAGLMIRFVGELLFNRLDNPRPLILPEQQQIFKLLRRKNDVKPLTREGDRQLLKV